MSPALHPGPAELAKDLEERDLPGCADAIRGGHRVVARALTEALRTRRFPAEVFVAQVLAWGRGDDDAIARSNAAWREADGCEACALLALGSADAGRCGDCDAKAAEARS